MVFNTIKKYSKPILILFGLFYPYISFAQNTSVDGLKYAPISGDTFGYKGPIENIWIIFMVFWSLSYLCILLLYSWIYIDFLKSKNAVSKNKNIMLVRIFPYFLFAISVLLMNINNGISFLLLAFLYSISFIVNLFIIKKLNDDQKARRRIKGIIIIHFSHFLSLIIVFILLKYFDYYCDINPSNPICWST